ncbi:uncharacterized protein LOC109710258 isoform X2 [Ananas comosus]|uniref:Uncharacterized protein LOC109710258 isoform X2 n=1 Tax=Ananas comosus TaxID=4615 RepID=A0A6P5F4F8_ANACO|nr:uncharacterized protein LOC109710258 isoform X2 [Ananas comosus]
MATHASCVPSSFFPSSCYASIRGGRRSTAAAAAAAATLPPNPTSHLCFGSSTSLRPKNSSSATTQRHDSSASAAASAVKSEDSKPIELTYLEGNSWLWDVEGLNILVDPILVGNLDFGLPWLFEGAKKVLGNFRLDDLPSLDCLLITQSLDDHCHVKTLTPLSKKMPDLPVIATPNAEAILRPLFSNVTYLEPGQKSVLEGKNGTNIQICATKGPILGPPWQRPENGYIIKFGQSNLTLYHEPHCVYDKSFVENYQADILITPVIKQLLPLFTLVSGQEDAVQLAKLLKAKYIVPMNNGDLNAKGILSRILYSEGTIESFKELLSKELPDAQVLEPKPGIPLEISVSTIS